MKKLLIALSVIAVLTFSACGKEEVTTTAASSISASTADTITSVNENKTDLSNYKTSVASVFASNEIKANSNEYTETSISQTTTVSTNTESKEHQEKKETPEEYNARLAEEIRALPTIAEKSQKLMEEAPLYTGLNYFTLVCQSYCYGYSYERPTEADKLLWPSKVYTLDELKQIIEIEKNHQDELVVEYQKEFCNWADKKFDFANFTEKDWLYYFMMDCNPNYKEGVTFAEYFGTGFAELIEDYFPGVTDDMTFGEFLNAY